MFAPLQASAAPADAYEANIADENDGYAKVLHAMLKIQDSAYLGEGDSAVLTGKRGDPASWRWHSKGRGALRVVLTQGQLHIAKAGKQVDPASLTTGISMDVDVDVTGEATQVDAGIKGWRLFVYNQRNPAALTFTGVSYFPFDPAFLVEAAFTPDAALSPHVFPTSRGTTKQFFHVGDARFALASSEVVLPLYADTPEVDGIKAAGFFTDLLTGKGAYGSGRYVDVDVGSLVPHTVTIDFNQAYNPNCARSAHFTCPIAADGIPVAVTAGERDPHLH